MSLRQACVELHSLAAKTQIIKEMQISVTNDYGAMYKKLWNEKYQTVQTNEEENENVSTITIPRL